MEAVAVTTAADRSMLVPPGTIVRTGYVAVDKVRLANKTPMAVGDVAVAFHKRLQLGDHNPWPSPRGHWDGETFVIVDGRHEYVATLMLGHERILVAWIAPESSQAEESRG